MLRERFGKFEADVLPVPEDRKRVCAVRPNCPRRAGVGPTRIGRRKTNTTAARPAPGIGAGYQGVRTVRETTETASVRLATPTCAPRTE